MAKIFIRNLPKVKSDIRKRVQKAVRDPLLEKRVGRMIVQGIQDNPMGAAGEVTKKFRKFLEKLNATHNKYKRNKINITFTGELLNDLRDNVKVLIKNDRVSYVIEHSKKKHKLYKIPTSSKNKGKGRGKGKRTKKSYRYISEQIILKGYNYMRISKPTRKKIVESVRKTLRLRLK